MFRLRWTVLGALLALGAGLSGCSCDDPPPVQTAEDGGSEGPVCAEGKTACQTADDCPERHLCRLDKSTGARCCDRGPRTCTDKSDCCPGQTCTSEGRCVDSFDECTVDADCSEAGDRVCREWVDPALGPTKRCTFERCGAGGACPEGQFCFADFCVAAPPCDGSCEQGEACVPQNNKCHPFGDRCDLAPKPGHLIVFSNPENVYDVCLLAEVACEYAELPPLATGGLGRYASIAARDGKVAVAHYDGRYGDLVVSDFDAQGKLLGSKWVDGVPAEGTLVASPAGPRGGIAEPGPDVGKHTDLAFKPDGTLHAVYYDQTNGDLRYAERAPNGTWSAPYAVDGADADVGLFASLDFDPQGRPAIAYFQRGASESSTLGCPAAPSAPKALVTGVKLARANSEHPSSAADWTVELVACGARPPAPCFGCTTPDSGKVCVVDSSSANGTRCATPSTSCTSCGSTEVCIASGSRGVCAAKGNPTEVEGLPPGVGLFPSLAFKGSTPVIAWYDHNAGNLVVSQSTGSSWTETIIDGEENGADTGDVGLYPSLLVDASGNFNLAYHDASRRGLRFFSGATLEKLTGQLNPPGSSFIDKGLTDPMLDGPSWVGADAALAFTSFGNWAVYQNSTASDLRLSKQEQSGWSLAREWTEGAVGFFADAAEMNGKLYIAHALIRARIVDGKPVADNQLRLEVFTP